MHDEARCESAGGAGQLNPAAVAPGPATLPLADRLASAGIKDLADPVVTWQRLREVEGRRVTLIDLYQLVATSRGLAAHELSPELRARLAEIAISQIWPGFSTTSDSGRRREPIEVADDDPAWPSRYARWRERLADALGTAWLRIEHVGSTAVPGLPAKPVIDIQVSVADLRRESRYVAVLEAAGVQLRSRDEFHRYFRPFAGQPRDVHVHVCDAGGRWEHEHLLFRDYLRAHPAARDAYADAKYAAAQAWRDDRWAYTEAKTGIVLDTLDAAERWAKTSKWTPPPQAPG